MSGNFPFGFNPQNSGDDPDQPGSGGSGPGGSGPGGSGPGGPNPFGFGGPGGLGGFDMNQLGQALSQFGAMLQNMQTAPGGPKVNWDVIRDTARKTIAAKGDPSVSDFDSRAVMDAARLADLWLDEVTAFSAGGVGAKAWSRSEWFEASVPQWQRIIDPMAVKLISGMGGMLPSGSTDSLSAMLPDELKQLIPGSMDLDAMLGPMIGAVQQMGGALFATQVGQALGELACEVVGGADAGVPVTNGQAALVMSNVASFSEGLGLKADDVRLYLAIREIAHQRLFAHVPWLPSRLSSAIEEYAAGIGVDTERIQDLVKDIDPSNPAALNDLFNGGLLEPQDTPEQKAALARLETLLALIEGWVDHVVSAAVSEKMPDAAALQEAVRRRRAVGGPAEKTFATLVGLELRPRRLRDAAALWNELLADRGISGRDAVWEHPDFLPTAEDLDDPLAFAAGTGISDEELSALTDGLRGGSEDVPGTGASGEPDSGEPESPSADK